MCAKDVLVEVVILFCENFNNKEIFKQKQRKRKKKKEMFLFKIQFKLNLNRNKNNFLNLFESNYILILQQNFLLLKFEIINLKNINLKNEELIEINLFFETENLLNIFSIELGLNDFIKRFNEFILLDSIQIQTGEILLNNEILNNQKNISHGNNELNVHTIPTNQNPNPPPNPPPQQQLQHHDRDHNIIHPPHFPDILHLSNNQNSNHTLKNRWPELLNTPVDNAIATISIERPDLKVIKLPQGAIVTMDVREDRVRVYHRNEIVSSIPHIG